MDGGEQVCGGRRRDTSCSGELSLASRIVVSLSISHLLRGKIRLLSNSFNLFVIGGVNAALLR